MLRAAAAFVDVRTLPLVQSSAPCLTSTLLELGGRGRYAKRSDRESVGDGPVGLHDAFEPDVPIRDRRQSYSAPQLYRCDLTRERFRLGPNGIRS